MSSKLLSMHAAIAQYVHDGMTLAVEGFTSGIAFAAAHEIIRQQRRNLTLCRLTPDLVYDQMIAAGCARKLVFSYLGNPGVGSLYAIRVKYCGAQTEFKYIFSRCQFAAGGLCAARCGPNAGHICGRPRSVHSLHCHTAGRIAKCHR